MQSLSHFYFFFYRAFYSPLSAPFPSCWNNAHRIVGLTGEGHTQGCVIFGPGKDLKWGSQASTDVAFSTLSISSLCLSVLPKASYFATPPPPWFSFYLIILFHICTKCLYIRFNPTCNRPTIRAPVILWELQPNKLLALSWDACSWQANPTWLLWRRVEEKLSCWIASAAIYLPLLFALCFLDQLDITLRKVVVLFCFFNSLPHHHQHSPPPTKRKISSISHVFNICANSSTGFKPTGQTQRLLVFISCVVVVLESDLIIF